MNDMDNGTTLKDDRSRADLRDELIRRYAIAAGKDRRFSERRHGVPPV